MNEIQRKYDECIYSIQKLLTEIESVLGNDSLLPDYYRDLSGIQEKCNNMIEYYTLKRDNYEYEETFNGIIKTLLDIGYDKDKIKSMLDKKLGDHGGFFK